VQDFERILTGTDACLTRQYEALLATDEVALSFTAEGVTRLAEIAYSVNEKTENIGARRLYTVMERLLEEISSTPAAASGARSASTRPMSRRGWPTCRATRTWPATCCRQAGRRRARRYAASLAR